MSELSQIKLRPYQEEAIGSIFRYFDKGNVGNPLVVAPTGSGKSILIGEFIRRVCTTWPDQRILMLAHRKELLSQNAQKIRTLWPEAPVGLYSASLKSREFDQITVGQIQSVYRRGDQIGYQNLILVDEAHLMPKGGDGMYQTLLASLRKFNERIRIIGFTATPYRMKSGLLIEGKDRVFTDIAYNIPILDLINDGYLSRLISKTSVVQADLSRVKIQAGEYILGQAEAVMDDEILTAKALDEVEKYCEDRKSWLIFTCGVKHAEKVTDALRDRGYNTECVVGDTPPMMRDIAVNRFRAGEARALVNCQVFTTGFDAPNVDAIIMLRPTCSPGLHVQMIGRGSRLSPETGKENCLILDFAGNLLRHGPIDQIGVSAGRSSSGKKGKAPFKRCPECEEALPIGTTECPECGYEFPEPEIKHDQVASDAPVLSTEQRPRELEVERVTFKRWKKTGKPDSVCVSYYIKDSDESIREWICPEHGGYATENFVKWWLGKCRDLKPAPKTVTDFLELAPRQLQYIGLIKVRKEGKYNRVFAHGLSQDEVVPMESETGGNNFFGRQRAVPLEPSQPTTFIDFEDDDIPF